MFLIKYYGHISEYKIIKMVNVCVWGRVASSLLHFQNLSSPQHSPARTTVDNL